MSLSIGIVGLPNSGKSTLFKALTKKQVLIANYPFATIDPNVGVIEVPDERLKKIAEVTKTAKILPASIEFYDIAGLVKDAHKGEGLGNQFLSHIKKTSAILHLVRVFEHVEIPHVSGRVSPKDDIEIINFELCMADLKIVEKRLEEQKQHLKTNLTSEQKKHFELLRLFKERLEKGLSLRELDLTEIEKNLVKDLQLLTIKPIIYVFNVDEKSELLNFSSRDLKKIFNLSSLDGEAIVISAKIEAELVDLSEDEQNEYRREFGLKRNCLNEVIKASYQLLHLITFFTYNSQETRAWPVKEGTKAPQVAGIIHTDFEEKFIRAEVVNWEKFVQYGEVGCKEKGLWRIEGKDYIVQDGDICYFRIAS